MLKGVAKATWLRGRLVHEREGGFGAEAVPGGQLLLEPRVNAKTKTKTKA
jgi:allantoinase